MSGSRTTRPTARGTADPAAPRPAGPESEPADRARPSSALDAEDRRLATLHLRLGGLALARAELEELGRRSALDAPGLADLAEARWRGGELEAAAAAAIDHLAAGGSRPIARVIAAEAAAAAGRPTEARAHVDALGAIETEALEHLFGGMPRRAFWPSAPSAPIGPPATMFELDRAGRSEGPPPAARPTEGGGPPGGPRAASGADLETIGIWGDDEPGLGGRREVGSRRQPLTAAEELARAREEVASGDPGARDRGLTRLALVLRLDPGLAADVLSSVAPLREASAQLIRGDACRLLGRQLEAESAFAAAARALDESGERRRRRSS